MKKMNKTPFATAMGTAVVSALAMNAAHAEANPFGMTELSAGYMQVAEAEMSCGEGKCGAMNNNAPKMEEGKCAGKKSEKAAEKPAKEGACGEGMCGAMMKDGKMKKGMEGSCGDMMKGKEGACGDMGGKDKPAEK